MNKIVAMAAVLSVGLSLAHGGEAPKSSLILTPDGWRLSNNVSNTTVIVGVKGSRLIGFDESMPGADHVQLQDSNQKQSPHSVIGFDRIPVIDLNGTAHLLSDDIIPVATMNGDIIFVSAKALSPLDANCSLMSGPNPTPLLNFGQRPGLQNMQRNESLLAANGVPAPGSKASKTSNMSNTSNTNTTNNNSNLSNMGSSRSTSNSSSPTSLGQLNTSNVSSTTAPSISNVYLSRSLLGNLSPSAKMPSSTNSPKRPSRNWPSKMNPTSLNPSNTTSPIRFDPLNKMNPTSLDPSNKMSPVSSDPSNKMNPISSVPLNKMNPISSDSANKLNPIISDPSNKMSPISSDPSNKMSPISPIISDPSNKMSPISSDPSNKMSPISFDPSVSANDHDLGPIDDALSQVLASLWNPGPSSPSDSVMIPVDTDALLLSSTMVETNGGPQLAQPNPTANDPFTSPQLLSTGMLPGDDGIAPATLPRRMSGSPHVPLKQDLNRMGPAGMLPGDDGIVPGTLPVGMAGPPQVPLKQDRNRMGPRGMLPSDDGIVPGTLPGGMAGPPQVPLKQDRNRMGPTGMLPSDGLGTLPRGMTGPSQVPLQQNRDRMGLAHPNLFIGPGSQLMMAVANDVPVLMDSPDQFESSPMKSMMKEPEGSAGTDNVVLVPGSVRSLSNLEGPDHDCTT